MNSFRQIFIFSLFVLSLIMQKSIFLSHGTGKQYMDIGILHIDILNFLVTCRYYLLLVICIIGGRSFEIMQEIDGIPEDTIKQ